MIFSKSEIEIVNTVLIVEGNLISESSTKIEKGEKKWKLRKGKAKWGLV